MLSLSNVFLSLNVLASCVHSLPFHIDVLSCSKGVEAAQDVVAGNLHVTHWKERKERHCLAPSQLATSRTHGEGLPTEKRVGITREPERSFPFSPSSYHPPAL